MELSLESLTANRYIQVTAIAVGSFALAYLVEAITRRVLLKFARKTDSPIDDRLVEALRRPTVFSIIAVGLLACVRLLQLPPTAEYLCLATLQSLVGIVWGIAIFQGGSAILNLSARRGKPNTLVQPRTLPFFDMLLKISVFVITTYLIFVAWQVDLTAWLASAGIIGIAVGFAAKDTLSNLFSGILIIADAPYRVGDFIVLDGELRGKVSHIGMRSTRILTQDDVEITVPNSLIGNSKIINESGGPHVKQRVRIGVEVAYGTELEAVREALLTCPRGAEYVSRTPEPQVRFRHFGASGLGFELLVWCDKPEVREYLVHAMNTRVYEALGAAGIEIPYAKQDIYIKEAPPTLR